MGPIRVQVVGQTRRLAPELRVRRVPSREGPPRDFILVHHQLLQMMVLLLLQMMVLLLLCMCVCVGHVCVEVGHDALAGLPTPQLSSYLGQDYRCERVLLVQFDQEVWGPLYPLGTRRSEARRVIRETRRRLFLLDVIKSV